MVEKNTSIFDLVNNVEVKKFPKKKKRTPEEHRAYLKKYQLVYYARQKYNKANDTHLSMREYMELISQD